MECGVLKGNQIAASIRYEQKRALSQTVFTYNPVGNASWWNIFFQEHETRSEAVTVVGKKG